MYGSEGERVARRWMGRESESERAKERERERECGGEKVGWGRTGEGKRERYAYGGWFSSAEI